MMDLNVVTVAAITVVCYLLGMFCKTSEYIEDKYIPVIVGLLGAILGVASWLSIPGFPADDWLAAVEIGIASGLASTGVNQAYKQLKEGDESDA